MKTPEEILNEHGLNLDWMTSTSFKSIIINAMEDYADQFKPRAKPSVDSKFIPDRFHTDGDGGEYDDFGIIEYPPK